MNETPWLERIENALVEHLKSVIDVSTAVVEPFPEDIKNHQLKHAKGAVLVSFAGSRYKKSSTAGAVNQWRNMHFDIMVRHRNRRGHQGAYALLDVVRQALTGFQAEGSGKFAPLADQFLFQKDAVWNYNMQVAAEFPNVECPGDLVDELSGSLLKQVTNLSDTYGTVVVPG